MGHAYLVADGCEEAITLGVCSADDDALAQDLMSLLGESAAGALRSAKDEIWPTPRWSVRATE